MRSNYKMLGNYIQMVDERNRSGEIDYLLGVSINKQFIPSIANIVGTDLSNYKIVRTGQFAYGPVTSRNGEKISIALLKDKDCIISSSYTVFEVTNKEELDPEYLMLWFSRPEFDRYARYMSHGSVREIFGWDEMCKVELPVPPIEKQRSIVKAYQTITARIALKRKINENLEATIQAVFDKMFLDASISLPETIIKQYEVSNKWTDTIVGKIASVQTGPFGSQLHNDDYVDEGTPIITVEHMNAKYISHRNLPLVSNEDRERLHKYDLHMGDVVFSRVGSVDRAVIVTQYEDGWLFSGRCLRVRPADPMFGFYLLWWFNQPIIKQLVVSSAVGATMPSINTSILSTIRLIIPPQETLLNFCNKAIPLTGVITNNLEEIRKLELLLLSIQSSLSR